MSLLAAGLAGADLDPGEPPAVVIADGLIQEVGRAALHSGAEVLDLGGLWLTPAPMDAHVHLHLGGDPTDNLRASLEQGIAAVRDLGHGPRLPSPETPRQGAPHVYASGPGLGCKGEGGSWLAEGIAGPEQMLEAVHRRAEQGACIIKVFASGLLDFEHPGEVLHPHALNPEEMAAAVKAAAEHGLKVAAHVNGASAVRGAVQAGVATVEHGYFLDQDCLRLMAERGVTWVPTLGAVLAHAKDAEGRHSEQVRHNLGIIAQGQMRSMALAEDLGVGMAVGTDAGSYGMRHGYALYTEIEAWLNAKLSPYTVYDGVTKMFANLGMHVQHVGLIRKGAPVWLLGVEQNPASHPMTMQSAKWRSF